MTNKLSTIFAAIAMTVCTSALAVKVDVEKKVVCDEAKIMLPHFGDEYQEEVFWIGNTKSGNDPAWVAVVLNKETQTWSVVMYNRDVACLLESGTGFKFKLEKAPAL